MAPDAEIRASFSSTRRPSSATFDMQFVDSGKIEALPGFNLVPWRGGEGGGFLVALWSDLPMLRVENLHPSRLPCDNDELFLTFLHILFS